MKTFYKFFTANLAREATKKYRKEVKNTELEKQLRKAINIIDGTSKKGGDNCYVHGISIEAAEMLEEKGFRVVKDPEVYQGVYISW